MDEIEPPEETFDYRILLRPWVRKRLEEWERRQPDWAGPKGAYPITTIDSELDPTSTFEDER